MSPIVTYNASSKCLTTNLTKLFGLATKASNGGTSSTTSPFVSFVNTTLNHCESQTFHGYIWYTSMSPKFCP